MSSTLWAACACNPEPIPVATCPDSAVLHAIRETLERQLRGEPYPCGLTFTVDTRDLAGGDPLILRKETQPV